MIQSPRVLDPQRPGQWGIPPVRESSACDFPPSSPFSQKCRPDPYKVFLKAPGYSILNGLANGGSLLSGKVLPVIFPLLHHLVKSVGLTPIRFSYGVVLSPRIKRARSFLSISYGVTHLIPSPIHTFGILIFLIDGEAISWVTTVCSRPTAKATR